MVRSARKGTALTGTPAWGFVVVTRPEVAAVDTLVVVTVVVVVDAFDVLDGESTAEGVDSPHAAVPNTTRTEVVTMNPRTRIRSCSQRRRHATLRDTIPKG